MATSDWKQSEVFLFLIRYGYRSGTAVEVDYFLHKKGAALKCCPVWLSYI